MTDAAREATPDEWAEQLFRGPVTQAMVAQALAAAEMRGRMRERREHADLVRRLDVALNGDGAAPQASLCDLVAQFERKPV